jgi:two-component system invasion response regulator UvrY
MNDDPVFAMRAIEISARGFVAKTGDPNNLVEAIRELNNGGVYLPPTMSWAKAMANDIARLRAQKLRPLTPSEK